MFTPGPWRVGRDGSVVADTPVGIRAAGGAEDVEYYGGYLVCETVSPSNARLIAQAPLLFELLQDLRTAGRLNGNSAYAIAQVLDSVVIGRDRVATLLV